MKGVIMNQEKIGKFIAKKRKVSRKVRRKYN